MNDPFPLLRRDGDRLVFDDVAAATSMADQMLTFLESQLADRKSRLLVLKLAMPEAPPLPPALPDPWRKVIEALRAQPTSVIGPRLAELAGLEYDNLRKILPAMVAAGYLGHRKRKGYWLRDEGRAALRENNVIT